MTEHSAQTIFPPAERRRLLALRSKLDFCACGIQTQIANAVGVKRQYVNSVLNDENTFDSHYGQTAQKIWWELAQRIEADPKIAFMEQVVTSLRNGGNVELLMTVRTYAFVARRLKRLGIEYTVTDDGKSPANYTFVPKPKA